MDEQSAVSDRDRFDDAAYLRLYPDIARAVAEGRETSAWDHFDKHGRKEGRKINDFDAEYLPAFVPRGGAGHGRRPRRDAL